MAPLGLRVGLTTGQMDSWSRLAAGPELCQQLVIPGELFKTPRPSTHLAEV